MRKRTTIELDERLLGDAQRALRCDTMRETVEMALQLALAQAGGQEAERRRRQQAFLAHLTDHVDPVVLGSGDMWR